MQIDQALTGTACRKRRPEPQPAAPTLCRSAGAAQACEPLTSALDAAVRLAADANVAAEALENLKRLLEHKQQLESRLPQPAGPAAYARRLRRAVLGRVCAATRPSRRCRCLSMPMPDAGGEAARRCSPPAAPRPPPERRGFDVRGFMAGFALSWAFGVVLYLFMTAG